MRQGAWPQAAERRLMRVLRAATYQRRPWKNGGGETAEIIVSPAGALFDNFDWRISMAHVATPGPFSQFPGVDRTLSVIEGNGLILAFQGRPPVSLDRHSAPLSFPGDIAVDSRLAEGPIDDLNVMTRRDRCYHRVARHGLTMPTRLQLSGKTTIVVAIGGTVEVLIDPQAATLAPKDALLLEAHEATALVAKPQGAMDLFVIDIAIS